MWSRGGHHFRGLPNSDVNRKRMCQLFCDMTLSHFLYFLFLLFCSKLTAEFFFISTSSLRFAKELHCLNCIYLVLFVIHVYLCYTVLSVPCILAITCLERADLLTLVLCVIFPYLFWVRYGTWLYRFLISAVLSTMFRSLGAHQTRMWQHFATACAPGIKRRTTKGDNPSHNRYHAQRMSCMLLDQILIQFALKHSFCHCFSLEFPLVLSLVYFKQLHWWGLIDWSWKLAHSTLLVICCIYCFQMF